MLFRLLPIKATCAIMRSQNHFLEPNRHMLDFIHPILLCGITYRSPLEMFLIHRELYLYAMKGKPTKQNTLIPKSMFTNLKTLML